MAVNLFPVIDTPDRIGASEQYDRRYKRSYRWNLTEGDFARDGAARIVECDGLEAYRIWCIKAVMTERKACPAYTQDIGAEMEAAFRKPTRRAQESSIERTIKETLMTNPRTEYVRDFSFSWNSDTVQVSFTVKGIEYNSFRMEV